MLDTGADANFTFSHLWHNRKTVNIDSINITVLDRRSCSPIIVKAAFGKHCILSQQIKLEISFSSQLFVSDWFYSLPDLEYNVFIGKPLLRQLHYRLFDNSEYITINGIDIDITCYPSINSSKTVFSISKRSFLEELRSKFPSLFSTEFSLSLLHDYQAHVTLQGFPYRTPTAYFSSGSQRTAIQQYIEQSLHNGLIEPIESNELVALSPVFPLQKSSDKIRIITDLRKVNKYLQYTPRPIPTTQSILSDLSSKRIFSAIDIRKAYQQLPLTGDKLGIITEFGSYRFTRLPYGLASAPYWWGEFIQSILSQIPLSDSTTIRYYYDDIIVASSDNSEHRHVLLQLFQLFAKNGLSISEEKLQLAQNHVLFLGYDISYNRIALEPDKVQTIANWKLPTTKEGIVKFIGFVNYLRNFIPNTSELLQPFYSIVDKKNYDTLPSADIITKKTTVAFQEIKNWITKTIQLKLFDPQAPTYIFTDASLTGAASVLFQSEIRDGKPIGIPLAFFSIKFTPTQQRYSTVERELFAVLHTLDRARLMLSPSITIYTDNLGIKSIGNTDKYTHPRFAKFLDLLNVYRLHWRYLPGHKNVLADYLSRFALDSQPVLDLEKWDTLATDVPIDTLNVAALSSDTISSISPTPHTNVPPISATSFYSNQPNSPPPLPLPFPPVDTNSLEQISSPSSSSFSSPLTNNINKNTKTHHKHHKNHNKNHKNHHKNHQKHTNTAPLPAHHTDDRTTATPSTNISQTVDNLSWPDILLIKELLDDKSVKVPSRLKNILPLFHVVDNILYIIRQRTLRRVITDHDYRKLAQAIHHKYHCTHRVLRLTMDSQCLWNPFAALLVLDVVKNCSQCEIFTKFNDLAPDLPTLTPTPVFSRWHLDFAGPLPSSNGYQHFLIAADYTSNLILISPCTSQTSTVVIEMLHRIFATFGKPSLIITDNGTPLNNPTVHQFAADSQVKLAHSSAYYPRGNSKAERSVQLVKSVLHKLDPTYANWYSHLTEAADIVNKTPLIYGYSPRQIAYGLPQPPVTTDQTSLIHSLIPSDDTFQDLPHFENVHLALFHHEELKNIRDKTQRNKTKIREALRRIRKDTENVVPYTRGEFVYRFRVKRNKQEPSWDGPYRVFEQTGKNIYKLISLDNKISKATYHSSKLKPAYSYYGSPIRSAAEYTRVYSDKERKYYIQTLSDLKDYVK